MTAIARPSSAATTISGSLSRSFAVIAPALLSLALYVYLFQLTKPSALSDAPLGQALAAAGYTFVLTIALSIGLVPIALTVDRCLRHWPRGLNGRTGSACVAVLIHVLLFLTIIENLLYSTVGASLKTDTSLSIKAACGFLAILAGVKAGIFTARVLSTPRASRLVPKAVVLLMLPALALAANDLAHVEDPEGLTTTQSSDLLNVVIISSDGIDASRMSVYGYWRATTPFLKSRAPEFRVYENAFTNNGNTTGSITALLSGRSPLTTGVVYPPDMLRPTDAQRTLPRLLRHLGYYTSNWAVPHYADGRTQNMAGAFDFDNGRPASSSLTASLPLGTGVARWFVEDTLHSLTAMTLDVVGIKEWENPYAQVANEVAGETLTDKERLPSTLGEIRSQSRFFINTHFMATHGPLLFPEKRLYSRGNVQIGAWSRDFYDDSLLQFDSYVERIYRELQKSGKLHNTLIVVTSDHGMRYDPKERIPLLIRYPDGISTGRSALNAQRLDVAPTILDAMGLKAPAWMEGDSLLKEDTLAPDREITATNMTARTLVGERGFRIGDDVAITRIRCGEYVRLYPDGVVVRGQVEGSTSPCQASPTVPMDGTTRATPQ